MNLESIQKRFESALEELNEEYRKRKIAQKAVICNFQHGVFIDFAGVEVNYSLSSLEENVGDYLQKQEDKHQSYLRVLQQHRLNKKKELQRSAQPLRVLFQRFSKPKPKAIKSAPPIMNDPYVPKYRENTSKYLLITKTPKKSMP